MFSQLEKAVFYYLIGVYLRQKKEVTKNVKKSASLILPLILTYILGVCLRYQVASLYVSGKSGKEFELLDLCITLIVAPICAVCWFEIFENLKIRHSEKINYIASTTFGVYLIHESAIGRSLFFYNLFCVDTRQYTSFLFPVLAMVTVVVIFTLCSVVDFLRIKYIEPWQTHVLYIVEGTIAEKNKSTTKEIPKG